MEIPLCSQIEPVYFLFSSNVPPFIYYSHFTALITSFLLLGFVLRLGKNTQIKKILSFTFLSFIIWVILALIFWATNRGDIVMFVWSVTLLVEPLPYIGSFYLLYTLIEKRDLKFKYKLLINLLYLPLIVFVPTKYSLPGLDMATCLSIEGPIALYYTYAVELFMTLSIICYSVHKFTKSNKNNRSELVYVSTGIILFLFAFSWGNIVGSFTENWQLGQYGLFGMPLFIGFLSYSIVKFRTFNIKILSTQVLVTILWIVLCTVLFVRTIENVRIITSLTLILFLFVGYSLIRSVKREVEQREKIEVLAKDLETANNKLTELDQMKSEFLSLASHQMRAPLTVIKGHSSMLLEGEFGSLPTKAEDSAKVIMRSTQNLINIVNDFLNISRIEQGRMVYEKTVFKIADLLKEVTEESKVNIEKNNLSIKLNIPNNFEAKVNADRDKLRQIIGNIIDNSVKYTVDGGINISLASDSEKVIIKVKDTGIGIDPSEIGKLFNKFSRSKFANKTNVIGTGLGLYIAKKMAEDQGGKIKVFSEGVGKGSTFTIELPKA